MEIYLPIAQIPVNWGVLLGIGLGVGFLSGMLGVSGGFITTPLLIFYGIPPSISVATQASPIAAASLVGAIRQGSRQSVDFKMGSCCLAAGSSVRRRRFPVRGPATARPDRFRHRDELRAAAGIGGRADAERKPAARSWPAAGA